MNPKDKQTQKELKHLIREKRKSWDLWRRELCDRTRSRGSPGSCKSAYRQCYRRRLCATSQGVDLALYRRLPSTCSLLLGRRIAAYLRRCCCYYYHLENDEMMKKKKKRNYSSLPVSLSDWFICQSE